MTERFRSPLWCWLHCLLAPPLTAHFPFPLRRRRWLKITLRWPALQRAARAAKGKDNVLAALIGVCGCHILITSVKNGRGDERKKRKRLHYAAVQGMQSKFLWSWASWSSLGRLYSPSLCGTRQDAERRRDGGRDQPGSPLLGSRLGAQLATLQANAYTRRNSPCDLPRAGPGS